MAKKYLLLFVLLASFTFGSCKKAENKQAIDIALEQQNVFPEPLGYVSDYTNVLTAEQITEITQFIEDFEKRSTNEIAIAFFKSIPVERDFKRYCIELSNAWGVGKVGKDNGVVVIVDLQHKRGAIYTGDEISKVLTDDKCNHILKDIAFANFKQKRYYEGLMNSVKALVEVWDMETEETNL